MKLIVLGSGTSIPHATRSAAAHWLETASGNLLLDISPDAPHRMAEEQLDWANLDAIWISHFHLDHLGGLPPYLFATRSAPQTRERSKPLRIYGAVGLKKILESIDRANDYRLMKQPFPVELIEVAPGSEFEVLPGIDATTFSTPHTNDSLGIRLNDKSGSVFVYTSDTGYCEELVEFARDASLLLMECSFYKNKPIATHMEMAEAMQLARDCKPKTVVLSHLYYNWDGIDLALEAKKFWSGETVEAFDGLRWEF
jgi:ribonuclease BN (tRNA processing enzyme)